MTATLPTVTPAASARSTHRWLALGVLALAQFLVVLDASIVNIALPVLGTQLHLDTGGLAWVITAYVLAFGGLLLLGGRLADRFGHRCVFLLGTAAFTALSALAGLSATAGMLLTARTLQGASAALLAPAALALLTHLFPDPKDRTTALGVWGGVAGIGSAAGVLLGGVLTGAFGWQAVFFVNVPIGVLVLATIPFLITRDRASRRGRLDIGGAVTVTAAVVSAVGALSAVQQLGPLNPVTLVLGIAALVLAALFVVVERRSAEPLVPFTVFRNRSLRVGNIVMLLIGSAMVALFFALSVFMQSVLHYDALTTGLTQLPLAGALVVVAGLAPAVIARFGIKPVLVVSLSVLAAGLVWLATVPSDAVFVTQLLAPTVLIGIGMGGAFITTTQLAVEGVGEAESGLAGGLVNTSQQLGGALGLAVLATVAAVHTKTLEAAGVAAPQAVTAGFSWLFLGAAAVSVVAAAIAAFSRTK